MAGTGRGFSSSGIAAAEKRSAITCQPGRRRTAGHRPESLNGPCWLVLGGVLADPVPPFVHPAGQLPQGFAHPRVGDLWDPVGPPASRLRGQGVHRPPHPRVDHSRNVPGTGQIPGLNGLPDGSGRVFTGQFGGAHRPVQPPYGGRVQPGLRHAPGIGQRGLHGRAEPLGVCPFGQVHPDGMQQAEVIGVGPLPLPVTGLSPITDDRAKRIGTEVILPAFNENTIILVVLTQP